MFNWEEYKKIAEENSNDMIRKMKVISEKVSKMSDEEIEADIKAHTIEEDDYEYIDKMIYNVEHKFVYDGVIDWNGSKINKEWAEYKERIGYYKRHPEEEEYSRAFTKMFIKAQESSYESE